MASPSYFEASSLFRISPPAIPVEAGDAVFFPADRVCHRAPPLQLTKKAAAERMLVFWFSWDGSQENQPDVDFQLNPWTLHHLVHSGDSNYLQNKVSFLFFLFSFFLCFFFLTLANFFSSGCCNIFHGVDGLLSIPPFSRELCRCTSSAPWQSPSGNFLFSSSSLLWLIVFLTIVLQYPDEVG